jgi:hypothetical protein
LIQFDSLFGQGRIPRGAIINSAELVLHTAIATDGGSTHPMSVHRATSSWDALATWNSLKDGITADGSNAILAANGTVVPKFRGGAMRFDVTESVAAWSAGAPNLGWALLPGGKDGWCWETSEASDPSVRPMLKVTFTPPGVQ